MGSPAELSVLVSPLWALDDRRLVVPPRPHLPLPGRHSRPPSTLYLSVPGRNITPPLSGGGTFPDPRVPLGVPETFPDVTVRHFGPPVVDIQLPTPHPGLFPQTKVHIGPESRGATADVRVGPDVSLKVSDGHRPSLDEYLKDVTGSRPSLSLSLPLPRDKYRVEGLRPRNLGARVT